MLSTSSPHPLIGNEAVVDRILEAIANYLLTTGPDDQFISTGRSLLRSQIERQVEQNEPIEFVLPAFPSKSPSSKKVLGTLPDLAEEIFLRRLEDLCVSVGDLYSPSAQLKIVSDGIVYSELLNVSDSTVHRYNVELCRMIRDFGLSHISFIRVQDLLSARRTASDDPEMTEDDYLVEAPQFRKALSATDIGSWSVEDQIKTDEGTLRTYCGYVRFLELDVEDHQNIPVAAGKEVVSFPQLSRKAQKRYIHVVAKKMMDNGARFSALVTKSFPTAIRLSIHRHPNTGPKFGLRIYADIEHPRTPWHNAPIMKRDGTIDIQHTISVDHSTHELVHRRGRPYYWREIDPAMQWGDHMRVRFDRLFPRGLLIHPAPGAVISWSDVPVEKMRDLASRYSLVVVRGCGSVDNEVYGRKASEMGTVMPSVSGDILELKEIENHVTADEAKPYSFDVVLKLESENAAPQFQVFQFHHVPSTDDPHAQNQALANNASEAAVGDGIEKCNCKWTQTNSDRKAVRWHEEWPWHVASLLALSLAQIPSFLGRFVTSLRALI